MTTSPRAPGLTLLRVLLAACAMSLLLVGCSSTQPDPIGGFVPTAPPTAPGGRPVAVVVLDTSASVLEETDLQASAQNRVTELAEQMPVGGTVAVKALNDVTANCEDLTITLPPQPNDTALEQAREANKQAVAMLFPRYVDCVTAADDGGTQLFGLLAETAVSYSDAQLWDVYTDGLDTYHLKGLGRRKNLSDPAWPQRAVASLPPALVPRLTPGTVVTWHALGRGTGFDAVALGGLRQVFTTWTTATGATPQFAAD